MEIILKAKIKNSYIIWDKPELVLKALREKQDEEVDVVIKKRTNKRTTQQNKYYWLILNMISEETGDDVDYLHWCLKSKFLTSFRNNKVTGKDEAYTPSTTKLNTSQFTKYVENIRRWAASFLKLNIPAPGEADIDDVFVNYQE